MYIILMYSASKGILLDVWHFINVLIIIIIILRHVIVSAELDTFYKAFVKC